eukprot:gene9802-23064_t
MGSCFTVTGSFISCFGLNLQKLAITRIQEAGGDVGKSFRNWRWVLGMVCIVSGSGLDLAALPFVPLSRIAALGASTIIANVIITPMFLGEKLTRHDVIGCTVMCAGTVTACLFGAGGGGELTPGCLLALFRERLFLGFFAAVVAASCGLFVEVVAALGDDAPPGFNVVWLHDHIDTIRWARFITRFGAPFYPIVHACFGGTVGSQSLMFTKLTLAFLDNAVQGNEVGASHRSFSGLDGGLFGLGIGVTLLGMIILAQRKHKAADAPDGGSFGSDPATVLSSLPNHSFASPASAVSPPRALSTPRVGLGSGLSAAKVTVLDGPYENERWFPVAGWGKQLLPTDRAQWSDALGTPAPAPAAGHPPPLRGWAWVGEWEAEAWEYAIDFPAAIHNLKLSFSGSSPNTSPPTAADGSPTTPTGLRRGLRSVYVPGYRRCEGK